jgi:SAM-dependent methyltransferase
MNYLLDSGPNVLFRNALSKGGRHECLILGAGSEMGLVSEFCSNIVGINVSRETLQRIKRFDADLILADAQRLPLKDACVDLVVCKSTLHHLSDLSHSVLEIKRVALSNAHIFLYEPGVLNFIAFLGRKLFPTDIHDPSERPFNPSNLRKVVTKHFEVNNETDFFVFVHIIPILEKKLNVPNNPRLLKGLSSFDALLCRTFLRNFSWILVFNLSKK